MAMVMYDLVGAEDRRFSPFCWRIRMALAHKGLECDFKPTRFGEIGEIADGRQKTVPVLEDGGRLVAESWAIAEYLDDTYPDRPSLFGAEGGRSIARFVKYWVEATLHPKLFQLVVKEIHDRLGPEDQDYFRRSREARLGCRLEDMAGRREAVQQDLSAALTPLRLTLKGQDFIGGRSPLFADHIVFGAFQWCRIVSDDRILDDDDPIAEWFERCLDLHDGMARKF